MFFKYEKFRGFQLMFSDDGKDTLYCISLLPAATKDLPDHLKKSYNDEQALKAAINAHLLGREPEKTVYKVWIELEEVNEAEDEYNRLDLPFAATREFKTEAEAFVFAQKMHDENKEA